MTKFRRASDSAQEVPYIVAAGLEALDLLDIGVAVTNASRQLLFANQTAKQILLAGDGMEVTEQNLLSLVSRAPGVSLSQAIQQCARAFQCGKQGTDVVLAVPRSLGKRPLTLMVRSLKARSPQPDVAAPSVLVFIWDPQLPVHDTEVGLRELFGFTSCEARLAHLLMEGNTVDDCCTHLDIRPSTVRMHLANLFAKTGVQRQGQLISLLWKSVGMVRGKDCIGSLGAHPSINALDISACVRTPKPLREEGTSREVTNRAIARDYRL